MSQVGNHGAPTPRRSNRLSTKASSVAGESAVTQVTNGGSRLRRKGPLTKVKARKSNAYGASGRVGAAEELSVSATGFAQAFQNQRGDAFARDDEEEDEEEDDIDELGAQTPLMSGALNGNSPQHSPTPVPEVRSRAAPGLSFLESEGITPSDDDLAASIGNTSKSFGMNHEGGMLFQYKRQEMTYSRHDDSDLTPLLQKNAAHRTFQARARTQILAPAPAQPPTQAQATSKRAQAQISPEERNAIGQSVDELIAEEQARLQKDGPPQPKSQQQSRGHHRHVNGPQAVDDWLGNVEPPQVDEAEWPWKKYLTWAFWAVIAYLLLSLLSSTMFSSKFPETAPRFGMGHAVTARISRTWYDLAETIMPREGRKDIVNEEKVIIDYLRGDGTDDDHILWARMRKLNNAFDDRFDAMNNEFDGRVEAMQSTLQELQEELPQFVIVHRYPDGRREISDEFWTALLSKVESEGDNTEWINFLERNRKKLDDVFGRPRDSRAPTTLPEAVSRHEFVDMMQQHYQDISTRVDETILDAIRGQSEQIKTVARLEAKKVMLDQIHLQALAQSKLVANYELNMGKANYFSPGTGAMIDPTLTSATYSDNPSMLAYFARRAGIIPRRNPPSAALTRWDEPGECWCSAPGPLRKGQAQLAVGLGHPMFPNQVTIEHVPMKMVPAYNISNAPRHVEVWTETDEPVNFRYNHREGQCQDGPDGWKCLGTFVYNIHAGNHVQTFDLDATTTVPITKAMVRVVSNWGADHTCLYRVRLHGDSTEEHVYQV